MRHNPLRRPSRARKKSSLLTLLTVGLLGVAILWIWWHGQASSQSRSVSDNKPVTRVVKASTASPTASIVASSAKESGLQNSLQQVVDKYDDLVIGVTAINLQDGFTTDINGNQDFTAASTTKLLTASFFLKEVESGEQDINQYLGNFTATDQLWQLVNQSNNDSWGLFNDLLGKDAIEAYAHGLGLTSYSHATNSITSNDMARFLHLLYAGQLLNEEHTQLLLTDMTGTNEESYIPSAVPSTATLYHKTGLLDDNVNDVAIIVENGHPYIVAIYSNGKGFFNYDERAEMMQTLIKQIRQAFL